MLLNYEKDQNGLVKQIEMNPITYNEKYVQDRYLEANAGKVMSALRLGFIVGALGRIPKSILDVGYGSGDFLKFASEIIPNVYGYDVPPAYPVEDSKIVLVDSIYEVDVDVACFFDSLEHFTNPYEISALKANNIMISVPLCHYFSDEWFENWKHRRPNEHLWHFNKESLVQFFSSIGYELVRMAEVEDTIRKPYADYPNIISGFFKKIQ